MPTEGHDAEHYPDLPVRLAVGLLDGRTLDCELGTIAADPDRWQAHLAALLRDAADELEQPDAEAS